MNPFAHVAGRVWLLLMAATIVTTWWLAKDAIPPRVGTAAIIVIAAFKVRLVLLYFMDLRHAPLPLRLVFEAWVLGTAASILVIHLLTPAVPAA